MNINKKIKNCYKQNTMNINNKIKNCYKQNTMNINNKIKNCYKQNTMNINNKMKSPFLFFYFSIMKLLYKLSINSFYRYYIKINKINPNSNYHNFEDIFKL